MMMSRRHPSVLALAALLSLACGNELSPFDDLVEIAPAAPELEPGGTVQLFAQVAGTTEPARWVVTEPGGGSVDAAGYYTAPEAEGTYTVTAQLDGVGLTTTAQITVKRSGDSTSLNATPSPTTLTGYVDVKSYGAKGDGITDDTAAFRKAAATKKPLYISKPSAHYKLSGKVMIYNSVLGTERPEIRMYGANGSDSKSMFEVSNYSGTGMSIKGLLLNGGYNGTGTSGEYSHLIIVKGSKYVTIEDNVLLKAYGDGVYVGGGSNPYPSRYTVIKNNRIEGARRCAVCIVSGVNTKITGNTLKKSNTYVSTIDVEPNPDRPDYIDGLVISNNTIDGPGTKAILIYTWRENSSISKNLTISGNTLRGRWGIRRNPTGGSWENVTVTGNKYYGDPNGPASERVTFVDLTQDPSTGRHLWNVKVESNTISIAKRTGTSHKDFVAYAKTVRYASNTYSSTGMTYRATISSSSSVTVTGNTPGVVVVQ